MNRRTFLASLPTIAFAGCAARLGLVDRVVVVEKYVETVDRDDLEREHELARRRYRADDEEPTYEGAIHALLADDVDETTPLVLSASTGDELEREFLEVRYGVVACESPDDDRRGCRDLRLFLDDFNEVEVGDVVDLRVSDDGAGLVSVHQRRDERG
ncbi:hypothetical protein [Natronobeatus ordinarius]|uniref:hypothetical protein n=1 Tax=Natronobeatus ordinarius TaxID=2963433 RepID=UPI0020CD659C|nr:hypothetical protein [Natronobeatus ordinarius]